MAASRAECFGRNLAELRKARGMTQAEMAEIVGIDYKFFQRIELGRRKPSFDTLVQIHHALGCDWRLLFRGVE